MGHGGRLEQHAVHDAQYFQGYLRSNVRYGRFRMLEWGATAENMKNMHIYTIQYKGKWERAVRTQESEVERN
jgi:hypothetical protein